MVESFFPLNLQKAPTNQREVPPQPDAPPNQQPTISGRILLERTAFVGQSFAEDDLEILDFFKAVLAEMGVRAITGERAEARSVSDKVKARIAEGDIFVGVLTKRESAESGKFRTSEWVIQEIAYAAGLGKKIIVLKEKDVISIGGIHGDAEYIEFDRTTLHKAALKLVQMIWSLNPGKMALNKNQPPQLNIDFLEAAVAAQPREPLLRVTLAQVRASAGQVDSALRELTETLRIFPDFAPARLELIKGLRSAGRCEDAEAEVNKFLNVHPFDGQAHHHLAHILEVKKDYPAARRQFELAQQYQPQGPSHFRCCGVLLYRTAAGSRQKLLEAKEQLEMAMEIGGQAEARQCDGWLKAIRRSLKKVTPPKQKVTRRRR
jgi:tetratricopeptide (TPR) repeat protein